MDLSMCLCLIPTAVIGRLRMFVNSISVLLITFSNKLVVAFKELWL